MGNSIPKLSVNQKAARSANPAAHPGEQAIALAPPAYGIDLADLQPAQAGGAAAIQRQAAPAPMHDCAPGTPHPNRTGLPDALKSGIEALSGLALDDVRVRFNSSRPAQLQALAYTQGSEIHVAPGQARHLPHEAWHVVQQKQGRVQPTIQFAGKQINDEAGLEHEADVMGERVMQLRNGRHDLGYGQPIHFDAIDDISIGGVASTRPSRLTVQQREHVGVFQVSPERESTPVGDAASTMQSVHHPVVQQKVKLDHGAGKYSPENARAKNSSTYLRNYRAVDELKQTVTVEEMFNKGEEASLNFKRNGDSAEINIRPLEENDQNYAEEYDDRIASLSHELQHAIDLFTFGLTGDSLKNFSQSVDETKVASAMKNIHTEWRAWAVEAASYEELAWRKGDRNPKAPPILVAFLGPREGQRGEKERVEWLTREDSDFYTRTKKYLKEALALPLEPTEGKTKAVFKTYASWVSEALDIFDRPTLSIELKPKPDPFLDKMK